MDQAAKLRELIKSDICEDKSFKVITVSSGKGGVGKSNLVANIAIDIAKKGNRVAILDADFGMANIDILLGINSKNSIHDILKEGKSILDVIEETEEGIKIIPGGSGILELSDISNEEKNIIFSEFEKLKDIDVLIIDTGAGIGNNVLNFINIADDVIIVTNSEPTSITDAYGLIKVIGQNNLDNKINIVVNRADDDKEAGLTFQKLNITSQKFLNKNLNYLGYILEDKSVRISVKNQKPFIKLYPNCKASKCIQLISQDLLNHELQGKNSSVKGYLTKLFNLMRR